MPSIGWNTTPPLDPNSESNDKTVARCCDGINPLRYAWRIGNCAANNSPHNISKAITSQNCDTEPIHTSKPALKATPVIKDKQVTSLTVAGVHLCCKKCVTGAVNALATVKGVKANTASEDAPTFNVTGDFDPNEVLAALNKAGFSGRVAAKP